MPAASPIPHPSRRWARRTLLWVAATLAACGSGESGLDRAASAGAPRLSATAALGEKIFHDPGLSASGRQACSSCHDPDAAHAPANALAVQPGGALLDQQGGRQAPSIRYLDTNRAFRFADDGTPTGGFFWDGRAASLQQQAGEPFLNPREMANANRAEVVERLSRAAYAADFRALYGPDALADVDGAFQRMTLALQQYQLEDRAFHAYTSKYDEFLRGRATLTERELRGLALFNDPAKGNCAACHPSGRGSDGSLPLFTDFSYDALGVPRNAQLQQNADPGFFDLGLCARPSGDLAARTDLCGAFKVPSLRNVARRGSLFHNGRFTSLKEALTFYVQRDTDPQKWYPLDADGRVVKFDDLPPALRVNVNTGEAPYDRKPGQAPALSDSEIDDVIAFLHTLDDGYQP